MSHSSVQVLVDRNEGTRDRPRIITETVGVSYLVSRRETGSRQPRDTVGSTRREDERRKSTSAKRTNFRSWRMAVSARQNLGVNPTPEPQGRATEGAGRVTSSHNPFAPCPTSAFLPPHSSLVYSLASSPPPLLPSPRAACVSSGN